MHRAKSARIGVFDQCSLEDNRAQRRSLLLRIDWHYAKIEITSEMAST
jgi:hypothetical protein